MAKFLRADALLKQFFESCQGSVETLGKRPKLEYFVRCFIRLYILDNKESVPEQIFWLFYLLRNPTSPFASPRRCRQSEDVHHKALLLILVYGPLVAFVDQEMRKIPEPLVGWTDLRETAFVSSGLRDLGRVLGGIHSLIEGRFSHEDLDLSHLNFKIDHQDLIALINTLIELPKRWHSANVATLLYFSGSSVPQIMINSWFEDRSLESIAEILIYYNSVDHHLTSIRKPPQLSERLDRLLKFIRGNETIDDNTKRELSIQLGKTWIKITQQLVTQNFDTINGGVNLYQMHSKALPNLFSSLTRIALIARDSDQQSLATRRALEE